MLRTQEGFFSELRVRKSPRGCGWGQKNETTARRPLHSVRDPNLPENVIMQVCEGLAFELRVNRTHPSLDR